MSLDQHIQSLFKVCDNDIVNEVVKGIYSSSGLDLTLFPTLQFRKAYTVAEYCYVNQVILGGILAYSKEYTSVEAALSDLPSLIITDKNNLICSMLIDWDALSNGNTTIQISGY